MAEIVELDWPLGWIASSSSQGDPGQPHGLLRMDNLTLDERGTIRLAKSPVAESALLAYIVKSIFAVYNGGRKLRYTYDNGGVMRRNYGAGNSLTLYDLTVFTGGSTSKAAFLNALGAVLMIAGTRKYFDTGAAPTAAIPGYASLDLVQPFAPVLTNLTATAVSLENLDGSSHYTNWTSVVSSAFNNAGATLIFSPVVVGNNRAAVATTYASVVDTTNFGAGTGFDDPTDTFSFVLEIDDASQLFFFKLTLFSGSASGPDFFWKEWDFVNPPSTFYPAFVISSGVSTIITFSRSDFSSTGAPNWATIKSALLEVGVNVAESPTSVTWSALKLISGNINGDQTYVVAEVLDTGQFVMSSVQSTEVTVSAPALKDIQIDRSAHAVAVNANQIRYYRNNISLGQFFEVKRQTGNLGFTPAPFTDTLSDADAVAEATIDPTKVLQFYRTGLTSDIIGMIYFGTRIIYLNSVGFYPSLPLDPGSYDSRFLYELAGTSSEQCLFLCKLDVGTFIVATTKDFYRVTGTFGDILTTLSDGSTQTIQDVNIQWLGISDPAISRSFIEVEGTIMYMSATGIRTLSVATSTSINTTLELLFRKESRYGMPYIDLLPADQSEIACVSSGYRIYWSVPFSNGVNGVLVSTFNPPLPSELRGSSYWRFLTDTDASLNPTCIVREDDGNILCGGSNYVKSLEAGADSLPLDLLTQYNFGNELNSGKDARAICLYISTGGNNLTLTLSGINRKGDIITASPVTINVADPGSVLRLDLEELLGEPCLAYNINIAGTTNVFSLNYFLIEYEPRPPIVKRVLFPYSNFGKAVRKKISTLPMVIDDLGSAVTINVRADEIVMDPQTYNPVDEPSTIYWNNTQDITAVDWEIEVLAPNGMEFWKLMPPEILQLFPMGKRIDQLGPFELDREGIVYMFRLRVYNEGATLHYIVYDQDNLLVEQDITTVAGKDTIYEEVLPKGVNAAVCKINLSSDTIFYRFTLEIKVRLTGKETDERWILVK